MKALVIAALLLAPAAHGATTSEFAAAPMYFRTQPVNPADSNVQEKQEMARPCGEEYLAKFSAMIEDATSQSWAMDRASQINEQYDQCVRRFGLTGYPELKVGDGFLRVHAFLRAWAEAAAQEQQAQRASAGQAAQEDARRAAFFEALGSAGRSIQQQTPPPPVTCSSIRAGITVQTVCR